MWKTQYEMWKTFASPIGEFRKDNLNGLLAGKIARCSQKKISYSVYNNMF